MASAAAELLRGISFFYLCMLLVAAPLGAAALVARRLSDAGRALPRLRWTPPTPPEKPSDVRPPADGGSPPPVDDEELEGLKVRAGYDAEAWRRNSTEARRRRIAHAEGRERARSAIRPLAREGYYAFEDVLTDEAGSVDQLIVGPNGVHAIVVRSDGGAVWRRHAERHYYLDPVGGERDRATGTTLYSGRPFEEDLEEVAGALVADVCRKLFGGRGPVFHQLCFTEAHLASGADPACPHGGTPPDLTTVWQMAEKVLGSRYLLADSEPAGDAARESEPLRYPPGEVEELTRAVAGIYDRRPWLEPEDGADA